MTKIALLNIGTELLRGRTINTNAATIGQMLLRSGFTLDTTLVIHDDGPIIAQTVQRLMATHDVILLTGGLGPTTDDITKKTLLQLFGGEMVCHEPTLRRIETFMNYLKRPMLEHNRQQAFVPSSCEVFENEQGTAPGMCFIQGGRILIAMPGVPYEMEHLMEKGVLPLLAQRFPLQYFATRVLRTIGIPESRIAEIMEQHAEDFDPRVSIAYLPSFDGTKIELKLAGDPAEAHALEAVVSDLQGRIHGWMEKYVYSLEDKSPVQLLVAHLKEQHLSFATAESCTGGAIAAHLVEQRGVSSVMKGGVVAYMREIKEGVLSVPAEVIDTHGIVSAQVAEAMAEGVRKHLGADLAVSITGYAEAPKDENDPEQPQAWIGFSSPQGNLSFHIKLFRDRKVNLQIATQAALIFAYKCAQRLKS